MSRIEFRLDKKGVGELLKSDEMMQMCVEEAVKIRGKVGEGYEVTAYRGKNRVNASVHAQSDRAKKECYENNTLLKAVGK